MMDARIRPLPVAASELRGLSEKLIRSHHENNYVGAVKRLNAIRGQLAKLTLADTPGFTINGLKREELIATNSMVLHELYFDGFGGDGKTMEPATELAFTANFGSFARWREEFVAMGKALGDGSGWVLMTFNPREGTIVNQWAADHAHILAGGVPLLALDMYEHAYHMDYGAGAAAYVDAFMQNIDFAKVYRRYQTAVHDATEAMGLSQDDLGGAQVLDVRRAAVFQNAPTTIPGAQWRDPAHVAEWSSNLPMDRKVIVYCVYGHEVGRATALRLRAAGIDAHFLRGGIDGFKSR